MAETDNNLEIKQEYEGVYRDTLYFIEAIVKDYGFYNNVLRMIKDGSTSVGIKRRLLKKSVDESWVTAIERAMPAMDRAIRNPGKLLLETEKVLPIEQSKNIGNRSLRHLAQHTDYISKVEGDNITPSKILNVLRDETQMTYENKFLNTLVRHLYEFIDRRWKQMCKEGESESMTKLEITTEFEQGGIKGKFNFGIELGEKAEITADDTKPDNSAKMESLTARINRIHSASLMYISSPFIKDMGNSIVRPPIVRTNALTKNKDLRECLALWEYIESYDKIGYKIGIEETAEAPDTTYIHELYSMLALQYVVFQYNIDNSMEMPIAENRTEVPIEPKFITTFEAYSDVDYDVFETEYKRAYFARFSDKKRLVEVEADVNLAIDVALAAEKQRRIRMLAEEKERRRLAELEAKRLKQLEEARIKAIERAEKLRIAEEERKKKRKQEILDRKKKTKAKKEKQRNG